MDIKYLSIPDSVPPTGYWDHTMLVDLLRDIPDTDRQVCIIPGAYQSGYQKELNVLLSEFPKVLVVVTSDEECTFDLSLLSHPDMILYSQYGNASMPFPIGYPPNTRETLKSIGLQKKQYDWFFAGQVTHYRRKLMQETVKDIPNGLFMPTDGFAKGDPQPMYLDMLLQSRIALCPPGPISQDSFRLYEALEAGCIPVVDDVSPVKAAGNPYVSSMFPDAPFPIFTNYKELPGIIAHCLEQPDLPNQVMAWWINRKYRLRNMLKGNLDVPLGDMVAVVSVSPIPSHPSTAILEETIASIRAHVDCPILVTIDGVREEQSSLTDTYREFIRRFLWKCNTDYTDVLPILFPKHYHQAGMLKEIIDKLNVPLLLYVEQDTPLTVDPILWDKVKEFILSGQSNCVRFHFEASIPEPHKHLMIGSPENGFLKTTQWSQRPALYNTGYLAACMDTYFSKESNTFIEDRMYGVVENAPWEKHKLHIYHPEGSIKRSYHLDGRAGAPKYDDKLKY